ncbi:antibiotic biosynthesis monooxygenase [Xenophilus arseniciresistens]|uniref:Antibiotic biosynthesis monooxygenase n=1 Tax=Xenophilus arseniciresistens TaxID=1283306 RepID=A0AAE3T091_9BURK|nr:antibiotic biosynthesis monooxygenase [Xenophilus arseniciresistens]MDA7417977.1 antibiotic biosynthesis monooxygenase [Xenophilus arseniciresistens]
MYSATFVFAHHQLDDEFHALYDEITRVAESLEGFRGVESWENPTTGLVSKVFYWDSMDALHQLMVHPTHLRAKAAHEQWLAGYQVVISKVMRVYGDTRLDRLLPLNPGTHKHGSSHKAG